MAPLADVASALQWVRETAAAQYSADPENVALIGHSSGAHLGALYLARERLQPAAVRIRAYVGISGIYDLCSWVTETHPQGT